MGHLRKNAAQAKASNLNEEGLTRLHVANGDGKRLGNASIDAGTFFFLPASWVCGRLRDVGQRQVACQTLHEGGETYPPLTASAVHRVYCLCMWVMEVT